MLATYVAVSVSVIVKTKTLGKAGASERFPQLAGSALPGEFSLTSTTTYFKDYIKFSK